MQIDITPEQYKNLILMSGIATSVFGFLGDANPDTEYKAQSLEMDELEKYLLQFADEFDCGEYTQDLDGEKVLDDELYEEIIMPILEDYEENELMSSLANKLAWRDFYADHSKSEIDAMAEQNGGYFGVQLYEYEKKYWDEFEKNDFDRLVIKK
jgi:hypothetical protein